MGNPMVASAMRWLRARNKRVLQVRVAQSPSIEGHCRLAPGLICNNIDEIIFNMTY
jgi:hypothetical protein